MTSKDHTVKPTTLKRYIKKINFGNEEKLPMMQGMATNEVIKRYKIPAIRWGYDGL